GGPVASESGALAQLLERPPQIGQGHRRAVAAAEDEAVFVVQAELAHVRAVTVEGGDEERVKPDRAPAAWSFRLDLTGVAIVYFQSPLGDADTRRLRVDVDEAPAQAGELARPQSAHQASEPHCGSWVGG